MAGILFSDAFRSVERAAAAALAASFSSFRCSNSCPVHAADHMIQIAVVEPARVFGVDPMRHRRLLQIQ